MKSIFYVTLAFLLTSASADVVSVNDTDKTVYFHPKPNFELNLQSLDEAGGILYLSLAYTADNAKAESDGLNAKYPGYQITALVATPRGSGSLRIDDVVTAELPLQQQQLGPYVNTSVQLSREQTKKLLNLGENLGAKTEIHLPVSFSYQETRVIERYAADTSACGALHAKTVKDAVLGLLRLPKPQGVKLDSTISSLKEDMLAKCFTIENAEAQSFADLLNLPVKPSPAGGNVVGTTSEMRTSSKNLDIVPIVKASVLR